MFYNLQLALLAVNCYVNCRATVIFTTEHTSVGLHYFAQQTNQRL